LARTFATRDAADWAARLQANDVPFAPALTVPEVIQDPQVAHLGAVNAIKHPSLGMIKGLNRPIRFDGENRSDYRTTPRLGEHTDEVLAELGIARERIATLQADGIV
jgi:formyl-CoA transferase